MRVVSSSMNRNRLFYGIMILCVVGLGLASRKYPSLFPVLLQPYIGDALWALMVFLIFGFLFVDLPPLFLAILALTFSFAIEMGQLYHAPWIDSLRQTTLGGLVLGFGFLWSDLVCYSIGVGIGFLTERAFLHRRLVREEQRE